MPDLFPPAQPCADTPVSVRPMPHMSRTPPLRRPRHCVIEVRAAQVVGRLREEGASLHVSRRSKHAKLLTPTHSHGRGWLFSPDGRAPFPLTRTPRRAHPVAFCLSVMKCSAILCRRAMSSTALEAGLAATLASCPDHRPNDWIPREAEVRHTRQGPRSNRSTGVGS